jgi:RNA polymerase sigma factor (sigma-70 family)
MRKYTESELIDGVKKGDREVILFLMKNYADSIKKMVNDLKIARYIQPEDVIQDGMVELILNLREDKFKRNSSLSTYYYSICRYICLKQYNRFKNIYPVNEAVIRENDLSEIEIDDRLDWVIMILKKMKKECIEIIDLRFGLSIDSNHIKKTLENRGFEEIAKSLNIEYANARQRFTRCMQSLLAEYQKRKVGILN